MGKKHKDAASIFCGIEFGSDIMGKKHNDAAIKLHVHARVLSIRNIYSIAMSRNILGYSVFGFFPDSCVSSFVVGLEI